MTAKFGTQSGSISPGRQPSGGREATPEATSTRRSPSWSASLAIGAPGAISIGAGSQGVPSGAGGQKARVAPARNSNRLPSKWRSRQDSPDATSSTRRCGAHSGERP